MTAFIILAIAGGAVAVAGTAIAVAASVGDFRNGRKGQATMMLLVTAVTAAVAVKIAITVAENL